ncbi:hypothetical protein BJ508DRAFT_156759 [Ascobolus immersus RN42]|uniref:Uncharacterized protein n=1 Tax=Ascobolus immersus RN42 TaxID=1160509 RepID=A0A3N4I8X8_ASCIM|nr:hypothetical protein BJ508DRAFT_156759 [Ascobolus immersus RN42]
MSLCSLLYCHLYLAWVDLLYLSHLLFSFIAFYLIWVHLLFRIDIFSFAFILCFSFHFCVLRDSRCIVRLGYFP